MSEEEVTIYFCDDEENIRKLYHDILRELPNFNCQSFHSAEALLKAMDYQAVDLVISDMMMVGGMTGYELAQRLNEMAPQIPVIIITGCPLDIDIVRDARKLPNVKRVIHKYENFKPGTFIRRIFETLENHTEVML